MSEQTYDGNLVIAGIDLATSRSAFFDPIVGTTLRKAGAIFQEYELENGDNENHARSLLIAKHALLGFSNIAELSNLLKDEDKSEQLVTDIREQHGNFWDVFDASTGISVRAMIDDCRRLDAAGKWPEPITIKDGLGFHATAGVRPTYVKVRQEGYYPYESEEPLLTFEMTCPNSEPDDTVTLNYRANMLDTSDIYAKKLERWTLNWASPRTRSIHRRCFATLAPFYDSTGDWIRIADREELVDGVSGDIITRTQYRGLESARFGIRADLAAQDRGTIHRMLEG